jgi:hypothetical protein
VVGATSSDAWIAFWAGLPATLAAVVTLVAVLRGRGRAQAAHDDLAAGVVHTYNAVADVAKVVGAPVAPLPVAEAPAPLLTSEAQAS